MNILLITPLYKIEGRPELVQDTCAIHYLTKYWTENNDVRVVFIYMQTPKHLSRYLDNKQRNYARNGYYYETDGVKVAMCEITLRIKQKWVLDGCQAKRVAKFTKRYIEREMFVPDVVVTHLPVVTVNMWKNIELKAPKLAVLHETDIKTIKLDPGLLDQLQNTYRHIFARSESIRKFLNGKLNIESEIIYSGVKLPEGRIRKERTECSEGTLSIIYVGKLIERKRLDYLIQAISQISKETHIKLEIYGDGKERERYEQLAKELLEQSQYKFYGNKPREEIFEAMAQADVFCMPSVNETLGLVYLEAMVCGCITIGSIGEGIDGIIIDGENGFLVDPNNVEDITDKIHKIIQMLPEERKLLRNAARKTMENYTEEIASEHYLNIIKQTLLSTL